MLHRSDRQFLAGQYGTQDRLSVRIRTHELYDQSKVDFIEWVLDLIDWSGRETVVDVGCGAGSYVAGAQARGEFYVAGDLSPGMLLALDAQGVDRLVLDAQRLPLADETADVILANHMLYHVPNRERAIGEFERVLKPGGRLLAATNGATSMGALTDAAQAAWRRLEVDAPCPSAVGSSFTLENGGELLAASFSQVERHDLPGALVFPEADPVIDYVGSAREQYEQLLPGELGWADFAGAFRSVVEERIVERGEFRVEKLAGAFVAWN